MKQTIRIRVAVAGLSCAGTLCASAAQAVPPSVPVTVVNPNHEPIPTTVATGTPTAFQFGTNIASQYKVPSGKRLEIDSLSYQCATEMGTSVTLLSVGYGNGANGASFIFNLPAYTQGIFGGNSAVHLWVLAESYFSFATSYSGGGAVSCTIYGIGQLFPAS